jgi:hypothetical protein
MTGDLVNPRQVRPRRQPAASTVGQSQRLRQNNRSIHVLFRERMATPIGATERFDVHLFTIFEMSEGTLVD